MWAVISMIILLTCMMTILCFTEGKIIYAYIAGVMLLIAIVLVVL